MSSRDELLIKLECDLLTEYNHCSEEELKKLNYFLLLTNYAYQHKVPKMQR